MLPFLFVFIQLYVKYFNFVPHIILIDEKFNNYVLPIENELSKITTKTRR